MTYTIHTYTAAEAGLNVNSYLVETDTGVFVIDTNLLVSDIEALRCRLTALKKPLLGIAVTHAHPDHFNGVYALLQDGDVPVYATTGVARAIHEVADAKRAQWGPVYGAEWPTVTAYPSVELADGQASAVDQLTFTAFEVGPAESHADSYFVVSDEARTDAFIGDLAFHDTHPYTADGHSGRWLAVLDAVPPALAVARTLYPGHGMPTTASIFDDQRRYLMHYREVVRRLAAGEPKLTDAAKAELDVAMTAFLPGAPLTWMIGLGADAVAAELAADPAKPSPHLPRSDDVSAVVEKGRHVSPPSSTAAPC